MNRTLILFYILFFSNVLTGELFGQEKNTIAVIDFEPRGVSQNESLTLSDLFRTEIKKTNSYVLVERNQVQEILKEQGFQQSGCVSNECAVEVGSLLGVQNMISGSIGKVGNTYNVNVYMFSVETGEVLKTVNQSIIGEKEDLLRVMVTTAWGIVGKKPPPPVLSRDLTKKQFKRLRNILGFIFSIFFY